MVIKNTITDAVFASFKKKSENKKDPKKRKQY